ncbi:MULTISPECIES: hypothetical protein [unclassified Paenibacillus]|uniref:hypothetical protein n=1 Tax=unclassified Paenibacillus TaxID=185978 RepID=UPI0004F6B64C|nr:hypothetical protein [Paenibacillus sp. FSL H7-0737]AIQ23859.1 hypothetical protein H70737_13865 [Paenibacillus sp. FSL H7-0737]
MVDERHLVYFKELLEGNAEISFKAYLSNNEDSLRKQFSPARFARLKFKSIDEIIKILDEENVSYSINDHAVRNEKYLATFHLDALNEQGRLKEGFKDTLFKGTVHNFKTKGEEAVLTLYKYIEYPKKINSKKNIEKLQDIECFAELELSLGDESLGLFLLKALASIERQLSEVDDIVLKAQEAVMKHHSSKRD